MFDTTIILHYVIMIFAGAMIGIAPAVYAIKMEKRKIALIAFIYCALGAMIGIWVSFILAAGFCAAIYVFNMEQEKEEQADIA